MFFLRVSGEIPTTAREGAPSFSDLFLRKVSTPTAPRATTSVMMSADMIPLFFMATAISRVATVLMVLALEYRWAPALEPLPGPDSLGREAGSFVVGMF